jgi:effector-binding domain-containing protein
MAWQVRLQTAEPRMLAAVADDIPVHWIGEGVVKRLNQVYERLQSENAAPLGQVVVVYKARNSGTLSVEVGVEIPAPIADKDEVHTVVTPGGAVAHLVHMGDYVGLRDAAAFIRDWAARHGHRRDGLSWEVYGPVHDDPSQRRVDIYLQLDPDQ